jgi:hypothetical protein
MLSWLNILSNLDVFDYSSTFSFFKYGFYNIYIYIYIYIYILERERDHSSQLFFVIFLF